MTIIRLVTTIRLATTVCSALGVPRNGDDRCHAQNAALDGTPVRARERSACRAKEVPRGVGGQKHVSLVTHSQTTRRHTTTTTLQATSARFATEAKSAGADLVAALTSVLNVKFRIILKVGGHARTALMVPHGVVGPQFVRLVLRFGSPCPIVMIALNPVSYTHAQLILC
jgi:hypothetical protein